MLSCVDSTGTSTCGPATHTTTTRSPGCDLHAHQHWPAYMAASTCSDLFGKQRSRQGLGVLVGTKLTAARHHMEGQWYPGLREEGC